MKGNRLGILLSALTLSACVHVGKMPEIKEIDLPNHFENAPALSSYSTNLQEWWRQWQDPILNRLIEEGLIEGSTIKKGKEVMKVAHAYKAVVHAELWPMIGAVAGGGYAKGRFAEMDLKELGIGHLDSDLYTRGAGILGRWKVDVFGQQQKQIESAQYNLLSTKDLFYVTQMALSVQIAEHYFAVLASHYQLNFIDKALKTLQGLKKYTQERFNAGQTYPTEISEISAQIAQLEAQKALLQAQLSQQEKSIAVLTGHNPEGYHLNYRLDTLNHIPPIPTGIVPSDLLYHRPDLLARQNMILSLRALAQYARADLFPKFYINFGLLNGKLSLNPFTHFSGLGPLVDFGIQLPLFMQGKMVAKIVAHDAMLQRAIYDYEDAVRSALEQVEDAYRWRLAYDQSVAKNAKAVDLLKKRMHDTQLLFKYDAATYDKVLLSELDSLKAEEEVVRQKLNQARATILLYQAVGGGWQEEKEEAKINKGKVQKTKRQKA